MTIINNNDYTGIYQLAGVQEMATGFKLNEDLSFEFYFTYGAADRYGSGTWQLKEGEIIFNSKPAPGKDFKITGLSVKEDPCLVLEIKQAFRGFYNYVYGYTELPADGYPARCNADGLIRLLPVADTVHLLVEFIPERESVYKIDSKQFNHICFEAEPWLMEVFFSEFKLTAGNGQLTGLHPLIRKPDCNYIKVK